MRRRGRGEGKEGVMDVGKGMKPNIFRIGGEGRGTGRSMKVFNYLFRINRGTHYPVNSGIGRQAK